MLIIGDANTLELTQVRQIQVKSYEEQSWDQFFGTAISYRRFLYSKESNNNLIFLEATGLIKHCQFDLVIQLMNTLSEIKKPLTIEDKNKIEKILNFIPGIRGLNVKTLATYPRKTKFNLGNWSYLETKDTNLIKLISLGSYRAHIENLCRK